MKYKQIYFVELTPFDASTCLNGHYSVSGPFEDRMQAEKTLSGAMSTGKFCGGTIRVEAAPAYSKDEE